MIRRLFFLALLILVAWQGYNAWNKRSLSHAPGVLVAEAPRQEETAAAAFQKGDAVITPLATFKIRARVLSRRDYHSEANGDLIPVDLALGWGPMSDSAVLDKIRISQRNRFYFWVVNEYPIPHRDIETHSANMHLVPASESIASSIKEARRGQIINIDGYLVRIERSNGWNIQSSLTRDDTGEGACEVIWVKNFYIESAQ
ncbi:MAG: hypothetical protein FWC38_07300 [Proteobacteria bacterium]|nr:hypothetical protein [Pseudomonadota bacterium]MCL2308010.1 hypothetical protein [Pseudomonadota bacterium]